MATIDITMPRLGESVIECTVISILKKVGERIEADDSVLEVATDKVDTEIPSSAGGIITEILVKEGQVVAIGSPIMRLQTTAASHDTVVEKTEIAINEAVAPIIGMVQAVLQRPAVVTSTNGNNGRFYSPLVQTIAQAEGISSAELSLIAGTGAEGRVTKNDMINYLNNRPTIPNGSQIPHIPIDQSVNNQPIEVIPMDRMRRVIAERMIASQHTSAHVTSYVACDMTNIVQWRERVKHDFKQKTGENLTYTPILIEALAQTIRQFPNINISVDGHNILKKNNINIGMAVALPSGNLIVPVIRNADQLDLVTLTKQVNDLAAKARQNKLNPDDLSGGTYTMSNIGMFGNLMGTPVIVQPQVAIMAFGMIQKQPVVIETPQGDTIGIRSMMYLSHAYDHRVVDGALGGMFVRGVADYLEKFDINRSF